MTRHTTFSRGRRPDYRNVTYSLRTFSVIILEVGKYSTRFFFFFHSAEHIVGIKKSWVDEGKENLLFQC